MIDISSKERIHFIGIGGIGMSGIARTYLELGCAVQGSDVKDSEIVIDSGDNFILPHLAAVP